jgi:hypothetical protein
MAATNTAWILVVVVLHASLLLQVVVLLLLRDWHMLLLPTFSLCFTLYLASSKSLLPPSYPSADKSLYPMLSCSYFFLKKIINEKINHKCVWVHDAKYMFIRSFRFNKVLC